MAALLGLDASSYIGLFLTADDVPLMSQVQDASANGADPGDDAFDRHGGIASGFRVWVGDGDQLISRLVDGRWVFPTDAAAAAYHRETLRANSEGRPAAHRPAMVGDGCTVFGGTEPHPLELSTAMTAFTYVFRVRNVVVKLFAFQNPEITAATLTPADVATIAERIVARATR